jgi:glycosyltransferase involved in cell wall biosynthesis
MKVLKIVHIIPSLKIGGAERLAVDICEELNKAKNIKVKLITFLEETKSQYPFHIHITSKHVPSITGKDSTSVNDLQFFLNEFEPDIIHSHLWQSEILLSVLTSKAKRFSHFHDNMSQLKKINCFSKQAITNLYERKKFLKNNKNNYICVSRDTYNYARNELPKLYKNKIHLISNAINFEYFFTKKEDAQKKIKLINIGSFVDKKNQKLALNILIELKKLQMNFEMVFLGDGPTLNENIEYSKKLNISKFVKFKGNIKDVRPFLKSSNIFLHTAIEEPFGLVILEAMASGLPVVALDGKGNRDIINHGINGFIFEKQRPLIFAKQIIELNNSSHIYNKISKNGIETAKKHDIKNYIKNLLNLYSNT